MAISNTALCPECDADVVIGKDAEIGEILTCTECGADLEVRSLAPPHLQVAPPEEEDWGE